MEECKPILNTGLRGVVIAESRICDVDGPNGRLIYRGYLVQDLAKNASFEEVAYLLLYEKLPGNAELQEFKRRLKAQQGIPAEVIAAMQTMPQNALPMDILQSVVPMLAQHDEDVINKDQSIDASLRMATKLISKFSAIIAAWHRIRNGKEPIEPSPELDHAANFLYMLTGEVPDAEVARFFDVALVCHAEHSFNASTFAAREVASRLLARPVSVRGGGPNEGRLVTVTLSYGIVTFPDAGTDAFELYRKADAMLYLSKEAGRNLCHVWSATGEPLRIAPPKAAG